VTPDQWIIAGMIASLIVSMFAGGVMRYARQKAEFEFRAEFSEEVIARAARSDVRVEAALGDAIEAVREEWEV